MLFSHFDETEKVYVAAMPPGQINSNAGYFIPALQAIIGGKLELIPSALAGGDRWVRDIMELGYSSIPGGHDLPSVTRTPNARPFGLYAGNHMLAVDYGYFEANVPLTYESSLNSFGNLECSPPIEATKPDGTPKPGVIPFPNGRVVYGVSGGSRHSDMKIEMRELLEAQGVQDPIQLDTGWLTVGHVDEFMSFIPDSSGSHGFKVAFANPEMALGIVKHYETTNPTAPMFDSITGDDGNPTPLPPIGSYPDPYDPGKGGFDEYNFVKTVELFLGNKELVNLQGKVQTVLNAQRAILKSGLSLQDSDFVDLPILFTADDKTAVAKCIALTPGSVNMLVVTKAGRKADLVIPKPFGPVIGASGSKSEFEKAIDTAFAPNPDVTLHYVDCFLTYHWMQGEIHCGTNSKRKPPTRKWWQ